ncbi:tetratricopeptide repeat protein [uncultured Nostoc sp.]|uniref:serine protease n=1 Tax=uncultured Nostoc sp. TaxID=340711 RepID=UPI0035CC142B
MNKLNSLIITILSTSLLLPFAYTATSQQVSNQTTSVLVNNTLSSEKIRQLAQFVTVKIFSPNKGGSGVLISKQGKTYTILTNAHVISTKGTNSIQTFDGKTHAATVISRGDSLTGNDLAVLQFQSQENYQVIALANNYNFSENQEVFAAGFPDDSKEIVITNGKISLLSEQPLVGGYQIGYTNEIRQGMSGGALLNQSGQLIGINGLLNNAILNEAYFYQNGTKPSAEQLQQLRELSFAVPIQTLAKVAPDLGVVPPEWRNQQQAQKLPVGNTFVDKVNNIAEQITVRIDSQNNGNGSGVIIAKQGQTYYVVTAAHVVKNPDYYEIITPDGKRYAVQLENIFKPEGLDAALVKFTSNQTYSVATIAKYNLYSSNKNRLIFVSGFPKQAGGERKFTAGLLRDREAILVRAASTDYLNSVIDMGYELSYTNLTQPGMSGGAVLDVMGEVIGINTGSEGKTTAQIELGLGLGVPSNNILGLVTKSGLKPELLKVVTKAPHKLTEPEINSLKNHPLFVVQKPPQNASEYEWLNYGNQLWRLERYPESVTALQQAIKLKPDFYQAYYVLGVALSTQKKYPEALAAFEEAIKIKPDSDEAWNAKYDMLYNLRKYPEALAALDKVIEYNNSDVVNVYQKRGIILGYIFKRYPEALASMNKAIEMKPLPLSYSIRGMIYMQMKDYQGALVDINNAIQLQPDEADNYSLRGTIHEQVEDYQAALTDYNQAIKIDPDSADYYIYRGKTRVALNDFQNALADCNQAIKIYPDNAEGYSCTSYVRNIGLQDPQGALSEINQAIKLKPDFANYYFQRSSARSQLKDNQGALADLEQAIKLFPDFGSLGNRLLAGYYEKKATIRSRLKDYQRALADINQAIKLEPDDANLYLSRGLIRKELNDLQAAQTDYNKAIEIFSQKIERQPNSFFSYVGRGEVRENLNDLQGALADYTKAIELKPKFASVYFLRGNLFYIQLKNFQAALADYSQVIKLQANNANAYLLRGNVYIQLKNYQAALADYSQGIKLQPDNANAYFLRGDVYKNQLKNYQVALADYSQGIKLQPDNAQPYVARGGVYVQLKDYQAALADYSQAIKIQPDNANAYFGRGVIYQKQGSDRAALSEYNQAIAKDGKLVAPIINIGYIKYEKGDVEGAIQQWEKAVQINGSLAEPQMAIAVALYAKGEQEKALNMAQSALRLDKSFAHVDVLKENLWGTHLVAEAQKLLSHPTFQALPTKQ